MALLGGKDQVWQWSVSWGTFSRETTAEMSVRLQVGRCISSCYRLSSELLGRTKLAYSSRLRGHAKCLIDILILSNKNKSEGFFRSKFIIFAIKFALLEELNLMTDSLYDCRLESCLPLVIRSKAWKVLIQGGKTPFPVTQMERYLENHDRVTVKEFKSVSSYLKMFHVLIYRLSICPIMLTLDLSGLFIMNLLLNSLFMYP